MNLWVGGITIKNAIGIVSILLISGLRAHAEPVDLELARKNCSLLKAAYSACGAKIEEKNGVFHFKTTLGTRSVPCTDGERRAFYDRLGKMDIASVLMIPYEPGETKLPEVRRNHDPGRLRSEDLLATVYGGSKAEVLANLVPVRFLGQTVRFQKNLGAARAFERVGKQLEEAALQDPEVAQFIDLFAKNQTDFRDYTFSWRLVKGTTRLSTHSFGTAIDLLTHKGPMYWFWDVCKTEECKQKGEDAFRDVHFIPKGKPLMPKRVVAIFEANGFIWGGKWNHYDTMHFEYRPEFFTNYKIDCRP